MHALILAAAVLLAPPPKADPTRAAQWQSALQLYIAGGYLQRECSAWTLCAWVRVRDRMPPAQRVMHPSITINFSIAAARPTVHGGAELEELNDWPYSTPLTLSAGGTWARSDLLPDDPPLPSAALVDLMPVWCVNLETDAPLTLVVAGAERQFAASNSMQIANIEAAAFARDVSISTSPGATVRFAIGQNPYVRFWSTVNSSLTPDGSYGDTAWGGLCVDEWRFAVARAIISDGELAYRIDVFDPSGEILPEGKLFTSETDADGFARDAFAGLAVCDMQGGLGDASAADRFDVHAARLLPGEWIADAEVWRQALLDKAELIARGDWEVE